MTDTDEGRAAAAGASFTEIRAGVVDVYVVRPSAAASPGSVPGAGGGPDSWRVLALQRSLTTRCPTAWETVHGRIEPGEPPEAAALREVREETGLVAERLYNVTVQPFYLHRFGVVQLAVVFAVFVAEPGRVTLGEEHQAYEWLTVAGARERFVWPREREALDHVVQLLGRGDAGPVEDVLRVV